MKMTDIIYNNLTRAYLFNKKAKKVNSHYYKNKMNLILNSLKLIKMYRMDNIKYEIIELDNLFLLNFLFIGDKYKYKRFSFHLPLYCKNFLNNI